MFLFRRYIREHSSQNYYIILQHNSAIERDVYMDKHQLFEETFFQN